MPLNQEARRFFLQGFLRASPLVVGVASFGVAYGVLARQTGLSFIETLSMSLLVFAGAAQFIATSMLGLGVGVVLILLTTMMVNLRHFLMSASLAPYMRNLSRSWQVLLSFVLTDESYALTIHEVTRGNFNRFFQLGVSLNIYVTWVVSSAAGAALGGVIGEPSSLGLDFALPATFLVLLIPMLKERVDWVVCVAAGILSTAGFLLLPGRWYIIVASIVAAFIGGVTYKWTHQS